MTTKIITAMPTVYVCVHVWHYYMYMCVLECVYLSECMCIYMHVYQHLHGTILRQTGISCKNFYNKKLLSVDHHSISYHLSIMR